MTIQPLRGQFDNLVAPDKLASRRAILPSALVVKVEVPVGPQRMWGTVFMLALLAWTVLCLATVVRCARADAWQDQDKRWEQRGWGQDRRTGTTTYEYFQGPGGISGRCERYLWRGHWETRCP